MEITSRGELKGGGKRDLSDSLDKVLRTRVMEIHTCKHGQLMREDVKRRPSTVHKPGTDYRPQGKTRSCEPRRESVRSRYADGFFCATLKVQCIEERPDRLD